MFNCMRRFNAFPLMVLIGIGTTAGAQKTFAAEREFFAGEAKVASQPSVPIHLELHRAENAVTGTISIPGSSFELVEVKGTDTLTGRFRGDAGGGGLTLDLKGDALTGTFDLGGQPGTINARRTQHDAQTFFRPPEQRLDLTTDQWLEDFDQLVEILTREHASPFHRISREEFDREVDKVRTAIPSLDGVLIALEFRKLGALIGDGHTTVALPQGRPRLPVDLHWFEDGLRLVGVAEPHRRLLGAKLVAVNDVPAIDVAKRLGTYIAQGETPWFHRATVPDLVNRPEVLQAAGVGVGPSFPFTFETEDGSHERVEISAEARAQKRVALGDGAPLWQRNEKQGFWSAKLPDGSLYVNWRDYEGLTNHGAALLNGLDADQPRRLIIDLRDNDGGDYIVGRALIEDIASRPWLNRRGKLYVMIGRKTFSAAMTNAVDFHRLTGAILVGEPAGAAPNNWQEVRRFHLPNSGLRVGVSTRYYEFLPGQTELLPDLLALPDPSDWGSPQDAGVRAVLAQPAVD